MHKLKQTMMYFPRQNKIHDTVLFYFIIIIFFFFFFEYVQSEIYIGK
jgi:TM2 domain-containing membrane protein YozV